MEKYESIIGLEIHIQLKTKSKMFCSCDNVSVNSEPNTNVCPVCMGFPGTLPVANLQAVKWTLLLGLALKGKPAKRFNFERKNYFYPDLPKAYQITSSNVPPVTGGFLELYIDENIRKIRINHIHLEEDAGKLLHSNGSESLVDLNRAGTPLVELVTEPEMKSAKEASSFLQNLRSILRYLDISDANMEEGNMRCDVNISLRTVGAQKLGTKVEVKNLNSFKMVERAIGYETKRQIEILEDQGNIKQETRGWDDQAGKTISQRSKEEANDYRYFPEPDLPPVTTGGTDKNSFNIASIRKLLPELPAEKKIRFFEEYGLEELVVKNLTSNVELSVYFEKVLSHIEKVAKDAYNKREFAKRSANWILTELLGRMKASSKELSSQPVEPENFAELIIAISEGNVSGKMAKDIFDEMYETGKSAFGIIKEKGLQQVGDTGEIEKIVLEVISENPGPVADFATGKERALGFLVGQVMKKSQGKANPKITSELLKKKLI